MLPFQRLQRIHSIHNLSGEAQGTENQTIILHAFQFFYTVNSSIHSNSIQELK